ncbi:hypothetical protein EJP617_19610 [Erwinia sp. Ejp617]|nr:hypothetical protein EJP617_19610 [Erwinia sp. Ejp617]
MAPGELRMAKKRYPAEFADIAMQQQADSRYRRCYRAVDECNHCQRERSKDPATK